MSSTVLPLPNAVVIPDFDDGTEIDRFILNIAPKWIKSASLEQLEHLHASLSRCHASQQNISELLSEVEPADKFALSHFHRIFEELFGCTVDIENSEWLEFGLRVESPSIPIADVDVPVFRQYPKYQDLLHRLIQGFDTSQCDDSFYYSGSGVVEAGKLLGVGAAQVAVRCREADVGRLYQEHIDSVLYPADLNVRNRLVNELSTNQCDMFTVKAYCSYLKGDIDEHALRMCLDLSKGVSQLCYDEFSVRCGSLDVFGVLLPQALVFEAIGDPLPGAVRWYKPGLIRQVILYLPGDPDRPFRQHSSWYALKNEWSRQLMDKKCREHFLGQFQLDRRQELIDRLSAENALLELEVVVKSLGSKVFEVLAIRQIWRIKTDAAYMIVPVAQVDMVSARKWSEQLKATGLAAAQMLASFIPGVGEIMLLGVVKDVLSEVYEGIEDWTHGECTEALNHFVGVLRTVAVSALSGAVIHVIGKEIVHSSQVGRLLPILRRDGVRRLWRNKIENYAVSSSASSIPDSGRVLANEECQWWRHGGQLFEVRKAASSPRWKVVHPERIDAFAPLLNGNDQEGWWLSTEHPLEWTDVDRMLQRGGADTYELGNVALNDVLLISGVDESYLRGSIVEDHPTPVELKDTLERLQIDKRIDRFLQRISISEEAAREYDSELFEYTRLLMKSGPVSAETVRRWRYELFQSKAQDIQSAVAIGHDVLKRDFPGLPGRYASALLESMTATELDRLESQSRISLSIMKRIAETLRSLRVKRALEGVYFNNFYNLDSVRLIFNACGELVEWPKELSLQVMNESKEGLVLYSQQGLLSPVLVLVHKMGMVEIVRGTRVDRVEDIYAAIIDVVGGAYRKRLKWNNVEQVKRSIVKKVLSERSSTPRWLNMSGPPPFFRPMQRLSDGRLGYPLSGRASGRMSTLVNMVRSLYPGFDNNAVEAFLAQASARGEGVFSVLLDCQEDYRKLEEALHRWQQLGRGVGALRRARIARKIKRCWRRQTKAIRDHERRILGYTLKIDSREFDGRIEFPEVDFAHVLKLRICNASLSEGVDRFLSSFKSLQILELENCNLRSMPASLRTMSQLKVLNLRRNRFAIQPEDAQIISSLNALQSLDLSGVELGGVLDLHEMTRLQVVRLRGCKLSALPNGLITLPFLELADLRGNEINEIPGDEDGLLLRIQNTLLLDEHDELSTEDWFSDVQASFVSSSSKALKACLQQFNGQERTDRLDLWSRVSMEDGSRDFFELLSKLTETADFKNAHSDLCNRIWAMLASISQDEGLRETLFNIAAQPVRCIDSVTNVFSDLEVRWRVYEISSAEGGMPQRADIVKLARGLFRLEQLQRIARADMTERLREGKEVDEIEISLAYRIALRETLNLPGQPLSTKFSGYVRLTEMQVQAAIEKISQVESSSQFSLFVSGLGFWQEYLRKVFFLRFQDVADIYWRKLDSLEEEQPNLLEGEYLRKMMVLGNEREESLRRLERELTDSVLY